jgi:receptor protein-tyrosine kinase
MAPAPNPAADWLQPAEEQEGLKRYVDTIRERWLLVLTTVLVTLGIAIAYLATATKQYDAEADLLITPVSSDDPTLTSLGLIPESVDPTRDVETASQLVTNIAVAQRVKEELDSGLSAQELLNKVDAEPVANSNIVAVTARDDSAQGSRRLANAFVDAAIADRTERLQAEIDERLPALRTQLEAQPTGTDTSSIDAQIAQLETLRAGPDPTINIQTRAALPSEAATPKPMLTIIGALFGGLVLGIVAAFASQVLDPRLRDEAQLRRLYRLPVLARIPKQRRSRTRKPLAPREVAPPISEAYRTLRATLSGGLRTPSPGHGRVILVTGSSASEGKTTTALNLAASLAIAGHRTILIESDLRRPVLGDLLNVEPEHGVVSVMIEQATLDDALIKTEAYGPNLQLLLSKPDYKGGWIADLFSIPAADQMIEDARRQAEFVIIDSPPLNEVVDALPFATAANDVLIVVRLWSTRIDKLSHLGELLAENGVRPVGFAVVGTRRPSRSEYHYYVEPKKGFRDQTPEQLSVARQPDA